MGATANNGQSIGVIGAGAWGTALASALSAAGGDVLLWARDAAAADAITKRHRNDRRLVGIDLDPNLRATADITGVAARDILLLAVPAQTLRETARTLVPHISPSTEIVICAKGYERSTGLAMTDIVAEMLGLQASVLSGPSFASDVVRGLPTAVTLAAKTEMRASALAGLLGHRSFRIYSSTDVTGVQFGGATKNVLAIAAGIVAGRGLGASAHAALVTRAFYELSRLGRAIGVAPETLTGLSCLGDLILTCNSPQSRNFTFGHALGTGQPIDDALRSASGTIEGVTTAAAVCSLGARQSPAIEAPIATAVAGILSGAVTIDRAIDGLLARPQRSEQ
jgi:glycerol-3-phosphate dehydrogenase (NAD(P)+)